jgi:carbonic anhydrase
MATIDELLTQSTRYASGFAHSGLDRVPRMKVAVVTCMDARINVYGLFGLEEGDAHVIRNGGGVVTDAEIRLLAISQRKMATDAIVLVHHTDCGIRGFDDDEFRRSLRAEVGVEPPWPAAAFADIDEDVRQSIVRLRESPFLLHTDDVRGFVYDVGTGALREITAG